MIKYLIWGAGTIGIRFFTHVPSDDVIGFIDSSTAKIGTYIYGKKIYSFEEYLDSYRDSFIVIATYRYDDILKLLEKYKIHKYLFAVDCPPEWMDSDERRVFMEHVKNKVLFEHNMAIYGITIFSLYLAQFIRDKTEQYPIMISNDNVLEKMWNDLKQQFDGIKIITEDEVKENNVKVLYNCCKISKQKRDELNVIASSVIEMRLCGTEIESYYNPRINKFRGIHKNDRCFIVGTGPSLKIEDLEQLFNNNEICFSVNGIFNVFSETRWRPDYYMVDDGEVLNKIKLKLPNLYLNNYFLSDVNGEEDEKYFRKEIGDNYYRYHVCREVHVNGFPDFSDDFSKYSWFGATVIYSCLQLAVYMGFKYIYLLGVDCNYKKEITHFYKSDFINNRDHHEDMMINSFVTARKYADAHGIKIFNATRGGMLEVFERVDFDSLIEQEGKKSHEDIGSYSGKI